MNNKSRFKENMIALYTIVRREIVRFIRIWSQTLLPPVISIALYFIIFGQLIGSKIGQMGGFSYINYIVPGLIMMSIITNAYANVVASFFGSKFQRNIEEMLVAPVPSYIILWGYVLGGVARGIMVGILVLIISLFFTELEVQHLGITLLVGLLTSILFSLLGLINGIFSKKFDDINIVPTFVLTPLTYLGGVFYSMSLLPPFWQKMSYLNPIFYMVNAFRFGMLGQSDIEINLALFIILIFIVLAYFSTIWLLNRGISIKS
jgi:ABC-2 type transport system permease protein